MIDLTFLGEFVVLLVVGICLCVGFILKKVVPGESINKWIPLIMGLLGVALNIWIAGAVTPEVILGGLFSGLASTGLHQVFKQLISKDE